MNLHPILMGALGLALIMFFTCALEVHRTLRQALTELKRIRDELENQGHRDRY